MEHISYISMKKQSKRTHWVSLTLYFDSFETEYIPQEVLSKIKDKSITHDVLRI